MTSKLQYAIALFSVTASLKQMFERITFNLDFTYYCEKLRLLDHKPFISFVIPTKNEARYLPGLLTSINYIAQLCSIPVEIIVADYMSADGTPDIARALFRRLRLLLGIQPIYRYHVREYTMKEVLSLLREAGFELVKAYYSVVDDLIYVDADPNEYLRISSFNDLVRIALKKPTKLNLLRLSAYPLVKLRPSLRQLIVVVAMKVREPTTHELERWG